MTHQRERERNLEFVKLKITMNEKEKVSNRERLGGKEKRGQWVASITRNGRIFLDWILFEKGKI